MLRCMRKPQGWWENVRVKWGRLFIGCNWAGPARLLPRKPLASFRALSYHRNGTFELIPSDARGLEERGGKILAD
jgi:hypothetical protein